jgi:hypothetical protein
MPECRTLAALFHPGGFLAPAASPRLAAIRRASLRNQGSFPTTLRERIERMPGLNEGGAADGEKSLHLTDRFDDHAVRLAAPQLVL